MSNADRLIAAITRRIQVYEAGDRGAILAPEMMSDAWELLQCSAISPGRYPPLARSGPRRPGVRAAVATESAGRRRRGL